MQNPGRIVHVAKMLCAASDALTAEAEARGIVVALMNEANEVTGHTTYGGTSQRYEAADALRRELHPGTGRPMGPRRYLVDLNTGELVMAVSDLEDAARRCVGSGLPRGWLAARMESIGWTRIEVDGHQLPGRAGRTGPHARVSAYRGVLPVHEDDDA